MQELADKRQAAFDLATIERAKAAMEAAGGGGAPVTGGAPLVGGAPATNGARPAPEGIPEGGQYGR